MLTEIPEEYKKMILLCLKSGHLASKIEKDFNLSPEQSLLLQNEAKNSNVVIEWNEAGISHKSSFSSIDKFNALWPRVHEAPGFCWYFEEISTEQNKNISLPKVMDNRLNSLTNRPAFYKLFLSYCDVCQDSAIDESINVLADFQCVYDNCVSKIWNNKSILQDTAFEYIVFDRVCERLSETAGKTGKIQEPHEVLELVKREFEKERKRRGREAIKAKLSAVR